MQFEWQVDAQFDEASAKALYEDFLVDFDNLKGELVDIMNK